MNISWFWQTGFSQTSFHLQNSLGNWLCGKSLIQKTCPGFNPHFCLTFRWDYPINAARTPFSCWKMGSWCLSWVCLGWPGWAREDVAPHLESCLTGVWVGSVIKNVHTNKNVPERHSLQKAKPRKAEQGSEGSSPYGTRNIYSGNIPCRQHIGLQSSSSPMIETCPYWSASSALWPGIRTCHLTHRWIVLFCSSQVLFVYFLTPKQFFFF